MSKKISVIIPIYNGQRYIARCVDSILNQQGVVCEDLEVLLLNDGSKDDSLKILKLYEASYPGVIKTFTHENMGVAKTRNRGIEIAQAKYIMFVDQDDWIDPDYCATFYNTIKSTNLDFVIGGYRRPNTSGDIVRTFLPRNTPYGKYTLSAAWAKIHRTKFLKENKITFFDNKHGEDIIFTIGEYISTNQYVTIDYIGYNWFYNEASVSNTSQKEMKQGSRKSILSLLQKLLEIDTSSCAKSEQRLYLYFILRTAVYYLLFSAKNTKRDYFMRAYEAIFSLLSRHMTRMTRFGWMYTPRGEVTTARGAVWVFMSLHTLKIVKLFAAVVCK